LTPNLSGNFQAGIQYELISGLYTGLSANYMALSNDPGGLIGEIVSWGGTNQFLGAGGGITYKSPLGPLSVWFGSLANKWTPSWYINLGYTF
jgi:hypothetical protein